MRALEAIFWFIWMLVIFFLVLTSPNYKIYEFVLFVSFILMTGIAMFYQAWNRKNLHRLKIMIKNIDFKPLEEEIKKMEKVQGECNFKVLGLEKQLNDLDNYKSEQEKKYREVVRKVLDVDNELNRKYKLLGEGVIKLSKDIKK